MPKVTVITPNYNHARYLPKRIESILNQTFQDFELIILDDASTDNSREVIEWYAKDPRVKTIFNGQNNGSTFEQWDLGLSHARGEYVWFAESDDYAEPSLLETLVVRLDRHPNVGLAYCQSWVVDQNGNVLHDYVDFFDFYDRASHWRAAYVNSGRDESIHYMFWYNTIPNASAVLLRRDILLRAGGSPRYMRLCGDWMTYIKVLSISDIAFVAEPLNYHRRHQGTARHRLSETGIPARETRMVQRELIRRYGLEDLTKPHRDDDDLLTRYVLAMTNSARRPPHNKIPLGETLALLSWFARLDTRAFRMALPALAWEQLADLTRRLRLLRVARKVKAALKASLHSS
jgi:glycosyltransferase involved in cell wall biosynthesis